MAHPWPPGQTSCQNSLAFPIGIKKVPAREASAQQADVHPTGTSSLREEGTLGYDSPILC